MTNESESDFPRNLGEVELWAAINASAEPSSVLREEPARQRIEWVMECIAGEDWKVQPVCLCVEATRRCFAMEHPNDCPNGPRSGPCRCPMHDPGPGHEDREKARNAA